MRLSKIERKTLETEVIIELNLDGNGLVDIHTGIGFLDHMLTLFAFHGAFDLTIKAKGDLLVDDHHTIEDIGIALGQAILEALGDKRGIKRYSGLYIPMDESLSRIVMDISNRPYLVFTVNFERESLGSMDSQNFKEFFKGLTNQAGITLHIELLYGENDHHKIESIFKGLGRALREATQIVSGHIASSKGVL